MLFHKDWIARSESVDVLNDPPLIVLLDISILVGKQLLLGKITFLHHCLKHLQRKSSVQKNLDICQYIIFFVNDREGTCHVGYLEHCGVGGNLPDQSQQHSLSALSHQHPAISGTIKWRVKSRPRWYQPCRILGADMMNCPHCPKLHCFLLSRIVSLKLKLLTTMVMLTTMAMLSELGRSLPARVGAEGRRAWKTGRRPSPLPDMSNHSQP